MKKILISTIAVMINYAVFAQASFSKLKSTLTSTSSDVAGIWDSVVKLVYVACAIAGLFAAIQVYQKFQNKDPDAGKTLSQYSFGLITIIGLVTLLKALFL